MVHFEQLIKLSRKFKQLPKPKRKASDSPLPSPRPREIGHLGFFLGGRTRGTRQLFPSAEQRKWSYFYKWLQFNVYIDFVFDIFFERWVQPEYSNSGFRHPTFRFSSWLGWRRETCLGEKKKSHCVRDWNFNGCEFWSGQVCNFA